MGYYYRAAYEVRRYLSWIEGLTTNQYVGGSNPSAPTTENQPLTVMQVVFLCREHSSVGLERLLDKQEVCGSNPHVPTNENQAVTAM